MKRFPIASGLFIFFVGVGISGCWKNESECPEARFVSNRDYYPAFHRLALRADDRILAVIYLAKFHREEETEVNMILEDLVSAKERGLSVRILLEKSYWDSSLNSYNQEFIDSLESHGIIASFDDLNVTTHAKCVVFDGEVALFGSTNWTTSALERNNEVNIELHDETICGEIEEYINTLWEGK